MNNDTKQNLDVIIVGAGFAGLYALHKMRSLGLNAKVFERADGVGGTWHWNSYPGARCDVHSLEYSYQFSEELQQQWEWSEKYAPQPEILEYANHVADHFDLRKDITFNTRIVAARFDIQNSLWICTTDKGRQISSRFCIMATGCLSKNNIPDFKGLKNFAGETVHTGDWPKNGLDLSGKTVGIIGTGSSAIQAIPVIAEQADELLVFQRTPSYSVPAHNTLMDKSYENKVKENYSEFRKQNSSRYAAINNRPNSVSALEVSAEQRLSEYEQRWQDGGLPFLASFNDLASSSEANKTASKFIQRKIKETVTDPDVAELLCPDTIVGCKRLCVDTDYYKTFNRDNVRLIDVANSPIDEITETGLRCGNDHYQFDCLILATGFDAMTGALLDMDITGVDGLSLKSKWQQGPRNYMGLSINGFPNLFTITGPGSPSVLANMIVAIEQHVEWIAGCLSFMEENAFIRIEAEQQAEQEWVSLVNGLAQHTLYPEGCNSWYTGANIPGKPRIFMPYLGYPSYVQRCEDIAADGYRGFSFSQ